MTIAILGGYGNVGSAATRQLLSLGMGPVRIGGRNGTSAEHLARELATEFPTADITGMVVDFKDGQSLSRFVNGCRILLNCAGPSHEIADRAAQAALRAGVDYVDAAGDDALYARLSDAHYRNHKRVAVLSAGLQPGLTGLLPRWLALQGFTEVHNLINYFGLQDRFTRVAADDYLQGAADNMSKPLAAWRNGHRAGVLSRRSNAEIPFFPGPATLLPNLNTEGERLATALGLARGDWYTVITGRHVLNAFDRAHSLDRAEAVSMLCQASILDLAGRKPHVTVLVQLEGLRNGMRETRTLVLGGPGNAELTGGFAALATTAVLRKEVPPGRHFAADALDAATTVDRLRQCGPVTGFTLLDTSVETLSMSEEGVL